MTSELNKPTIIKSIPKISKYFGISIGTFRNNYLYPILELERRTGIDSGIIIGGAAKKKLYLFVMDRFMNAMLAVNKDKVVGTTRYDAVVQEKNESESFNIVSDDTRYNIINSNGKLCQVEIKTLGERSDRCH